MNATQHTSASPSIPVRRAKDAMGVRAQDLTEGRGHTAQGDCEGGGALSNEQRTEKTGAACNGADEESGYCPYFQHVVELLGRRWTSSIVMHLTKGPARFTDIAGAIPGLSDRLLTERLHELETENLVQRVWKDTCTYYQFSDLGKELLPSIEALKEFAHKAAPTIVFADRPGRRI